MRVRNRAWLLRSALGAAAMLAACNAEEAPAPGTPAGGAAPPAADTMTVGGDTGVQQAAQPDLVRETFRYRGSGRDPFISLLRSGDVRPLLEDLRVTTINFNLRFPGNSVAVLRDTTVGKRYTVRVGDELGRLRIAEIRASEVLVRFTDFGQEREAVLRLRRRQQEELP